MSSINNFYNLKRVYEYQLWGTVSGYHRSFMRLVNSAYGTGTATARDRWLVCLNDRDDQGGG